MERRKKKRWSQRKRPIFFNVYIVHDEYLVEENVLTKTYLLANKIYCVYIPTAFSLWRRERDLSRSSGGFHRMTFNAVNRVNFLSNNKWQARATLSLLSLPVCGFCWAFSRVFARSFFCRMWRKKKVKSAAEGPCRSCWRKQQQKNRI